MMHSPIQAVIFDWAGTIVDFGSFAPTTIFVEAFQQGFDFEISLDEARVPMGLGKWDHIQAVGRLPDVAQRWEQQMGRAMSSADIDAIYAAFMPLQIAKVADYAAPIPHAIEVVNALKQRGIKIGSCSGYPRQVMDVLLPAAQAYGYQPDYVVATDDLPQGGRPAPFMALKNVIELGVTDVRACIKVDDAVPGIDEGHNAGMWTVGLLLSGNEAGLTEQEYLSADEATLNAARVRARDKLSQANPHYLIDTIADFPAVVADIERRLLAGERP
ncbi:phosphonoacetaldehyde hydrolase [Vibrio fluvialis]|uniref:phosphonoacetaldehyde hydrolase n=1 Tax=Vibrio fluvialis TaxID=676 RepID=UPI001C9C4D97|nr:phosphonoacetaldehyde hydrolase [Vibrio fluvialis]ELD1798148.1 phosphonoacetaldehyde hydrolase [Vibrio fluvialis]MBY7935681.1 phosphonoacetaldehyde hydrolase [Vibrio fluvialis]MCE7583068.1 phosphonoacetaldehyde hydrolase [Vibrio fluvialis]